MSTLIVTIAFIHLLAVMSPGPDFLFVTRTAVSQSRSKTILGVVGITVGVAFWAGLSILGLQVVFHVLPWIQSFMTVAGGLYLMWMGIDLLKSALCSAKTTKVTTTDDHRDTTASGNMRHPFFFGLLTNLANPKAFVYFASIFSGLITTDTGDVLRILIFAIVVVETFLWFALVALIFGLSPLRRAYRRLCRYIDGLAGVLFVGFGLGLIWSAVKSFQFQSVPNG